MRRRARRRLHRIRRAAITVTAAAAVLATMGAPAAGQVGTGDSGGIGDTGGADSTARLRIVAVDSSAHPEVTLTVDPPAELADTELDASAFHLTENGDPLDVRVARVGDDGAAASTAPGLEVVLVVDTSGSMQGEPLAGAEQAARSFLAQMPPGTRVAVVAFGDTPQLVSPMSADTAAAMAALDGLEASGETALYDALGTALAQFGPPAESLRQSLVVLSDGGDTASSATLEATSALVSDAGVEFAAVELVTSEYDGTALRTLAGAGGGTIVSADAPEQLVTSYEAVASDLLNRYLVTYTTQRGGSTTVELTVDAAGVTATTSRAVQLPTLRSGPALAAPEARVAPEPGWLGSTAALYTGTAMLATLLAALSARVIFRPRERRVHLAGRFGERTANIRFPAVSEWGERLSDAAQRRLERTGRDSNLYRSLEQAGIELRPGELVVMAALSGVGALAVGTLFVHPIVGMLLAGAVGTAFPVVLRRKARRRKARFGEQLADTLQLITGSLRAGHSILQAVDSVATDAPSPTKEEFHRLVTETRLGRDLPDALWAMHQRIGNQDFEWFVQALQIHREVGGDLAEILDTVATTVRDRTHLRRQVQTLSAEGRLSAVILFVLPIAVGAMVSIVNPGYLSELFEPGIGLALLTAAGLLMTVGAIWLRTMTRLEF